MQRQVIILLMFMIGFGLVFSGCRKEQKDAENTIKPLIIEKQQIPADSIEKCIDSSKIRKDAMCIQVYDPVCGCDGKTYSNSCMASINGILKWTNGECKKSKK